MAAMEFRIHQLEQENERLKLSVQARDAIIDHEGTADLQARLSEERKRGDRYEKGYHRLEARLSAAEAVVKRMEAVRGPTVEGHYVDDEVSEGIARSVHYWASELRAAMYEVAA